MMLFSLEENANIGSIFRGSPEGANDAWWTWSSTGRAGRAHHRSPACAQCHRARHHGAAGKCTRCGRGRSTLVIKGAGERAFVSGGDLKELSALRTEEDAAAMAKRMRSDLRSARRLPGSGDRGAERPRFRRRRRGRCRRRHPGGRRRHQDRLQSGGARDHAGLGRRRATGRAGRKEQGAAVGGHRAALDAVEAERIGLVDLVLPRSSFDSPTRAGDRSPSRWPAIRRPR